MTIHWEQQPYDIVIPYGDYRAAHFDTFWLFDLDADILCFLKYSGKRGSVSLDIARKRLLSFDDFKPWNEPAPLSLNEYDFPAPYWDFKPRVCARRKMFLQRILDDFAHQWRHVLRKRYNDLTLRKMARAIVRIATMDFAIKEIAGSRHNPQGRYVWINDLPKWESYEADLVKVGCFWFALSQSPSGGLKKIREHVEMEQTRRTTARVGDEKAQYYMILSVRYIVLCRAHGHKLEWTRPEKLYDGESRPSDRAVDLLLSVTALEDPPSDTTLHRLPFELQDRILHFTSPGPIVSAQLGCNLGLGSPFLWMDWTMSIYADTAYRNRFAGSSPVESEIYFDDHMSGVVYKARRPATKVQPGNTPRSWPAISAISEGPRRE